jgi:hypothetical protein
MRAEHWSGRETVGVIWVYLKRPDVSKVIDTGWGASSFSGSYLGCWTIILTQLIIVYVENDFIHLEDNR